MLRTRTGGIHRECDLCQLKIREKEYFTRILGNVVVHIFKDVNMLLEMSVR
jgi:hypothetical protein